MTIIFITILITHWLADFVCQTDEMAKEKSTDLSILFTHTFIYTAVWILPIMMVGILYGIGFKVLWFLPITFLSHSLIDYYTSKTNSQLYKENKYHAFFTSIGLDQVLHYMQLWFTIKLLL